MAARARGLRLTRRALLGAGAASVLAGCGADDERTPPPPPAKGVERVRYGTDHDDQFADLRLPAQTPLATLVLLHGGYWYPQYGLEQLDPVAEEMTRAGWATWNVEYRRTGAGGGWPHTLADVAAAVDRLAAEQLAKTVVLMGHSAGGHLAVWAASRTAATPGGAPKVQPQGAISLAGVLALTRAADASGSAGPVTEFLGGTPAEVPDRYALSDPALLVPAGCPVWAVHAEEDTVVPTEQATTYVETARAAGADVTAVSVPGDHFTIIDPDAASFRTIRTLLDDAVA